MDSEELFNKIKNNQIKCSEVKNKQNEFFKKTDEQKKVIDNLNKFYNSREEVINFFRNYIKILSDAHYDAKQNETKGTRLKILRSRQMLQRLPIALAQLKAGNNSENLLNEIRQIVYFLYQSKQMNNRIYSITYKQ